MALVEWVVDGILNWISNWEYLGILLLMALESACMPVPSEIVMPFSGYLVWDGSTGMTFWGVVLVGSFGCTVGSIAAYAAGFYAGRPAIIRYGKYFLISEKHLKQAERWFEKWGSIATFLARLMPVVRTIISLPAGVAKMNFPKFVLFSFVGSVPWNAMLTYVGYALGPRWEEIEGVWKYLDIMVIAGAIAIIAWYAIGLYKDRKGPKEVQNGADRAEARPDDKEGHA
ncbi:MAG TPA: DedA family protein [Thermoplasmata archaeon]|jgi:membrane protein DedA with SNARE-associated domain